MNRLVPPQVVAVFELLVADGTDMSSTAWTNWWLFWRERGKKDTCSI